MLFKVGNVQAVVNATLTVRVHAANTRLPSYFQTYCEYSLECPTAKDGQPEFYCPTPDRNGNWRCIDDFQLVRNFIFIMLNCQPFFV